jgi:phosphatidylglycerol lysyltransferase
MSPVSHSARRDETRAASGNAPDRSILLFFALVAVTAFLATMLLVEDNLFMLFWQKLVFLLPGGDHDIHFATLGIIGGWKGYRLKTPETKGPAPSRDEIDRAVALLDGQPNASAGLVRLGDKKLLFSECGNAFIMYARQGRSLVALFDPVGPHDLWPDLLTRFIALARQQRCRPVFYQVSPEFLPHAFDSGLRPYKLGEQAVVDLTRFDLKGGAWLKLRRSINRAERDGLEFAMMSAEQVPEIIDELLSVSRTWLAAHNASEKGFSLGTFDPAYVKAGPVAVIRLEGRIVAFASILEAGQHGDAFIDLMRHIPDTHRGMMDLLFVRIMEHMKARGFRTLNLGMAPLAGLVEHRYAPLWNHVGRQVFQFGERFYNFRGVQAFKSKFDPVWQPRYLVVAGRRGMPVISLYDVTMLIGGGLNGVLRR